MKNQIKKHQWKILISALVVIAIVFGVYALMWQRYEKNAFDPFSTVLESLNMHKHTADEHPNVSTYREAYDMESYVFTVARPSFLRFGGNVQFFAQREVVLVEDEMTRTGRYILDLTYFPHSGRLSLRIDGFLEDTNGSGVHIRSAAGSAVDSNGKPLDRHPEDSEEYYQKWLALYEQYNEPIIELFDHIKEIFGEEAFIHNA